MSAQLISLDLETTGTDARVHRLWEIGIVAADGTKMHYQVPPNNFIMADPVALQIGGFYSRFTWPEGDLAHDHRSVHYHGAEELPYNEVNKLDVAVKIAELTAGCTFLCANPGFDTTFLATFLLEHGLAPAWHHRHLDLGSFCAGAWQSDMPLSTQTIGERFPNEKAHTAFGDAEWNMEVYRKITGDALR